MSFDYEHLIVDIPDYPQPGVVFKDITPLIASPEGFQAVVSQLVEHFSAAGATKVMGAEARGFMVAAPVAYALHAGFVPFAGPLQKLCTLGQELSVQSPEYTVFNKVQAYLRGVCTMACFFWCVV